MKLNRLAFGLMALSATLITSLLFANWPQWRGLKRNGISIQKGLLQEWPKDGPKLLWQAKDAGSGFSAPADYCGQLYLLGNNGTDDEFVEKFSAADGHKVWSTTIGKVGNPDQHPAYPGARSTPTVGSPGLYALGSDGDLVCLDLASSGKVIWKKNLRSDFGGKPGIWAYAESPLLDDGKLICTPGGNDATMIALDMKTGDVIWKCAVPGGDQAAYSSIVVSNAAGVKQYVQFVQHGLIGVDAKTGKFLWRYKKTSDGSPANIPTPLVDGDYVYSATGKGGGGLIKIVRDDSRKEGDALKVEEVYFSGQLPTAIGGVVKVGDYLYGTNSQALMCVKFLTGEVVWSERGISAASILYADGRLYLHGENGEVALVEASPKAYKELGRFTPPGEPDRGKAKAWAYPVVANGQLIIRDLNMLWCYDVKSAKAEK